MKNENKISQVSIDELTFFFSIFSDKTRMSIIFLLYDKDLCVNDIASLLALSQSRVSHQLAILRNLEIVKVTKDGKKSIYSLNDTHIQEILKVGIEHIKEKGKEVYSSSKIICEDE